MFTGKGAAVTAYQSRGLPEKPFHDIPARRASWVKGYSYMSAACSEVPVHNAAKFMFFQQGSEVRKIGRKMLGRNCCVLPPGP
jgi:hypothetical protein